MTLKQLNNKPKILFTNFGRLEKNLFFHFDYSEDFDVVGIVTEFSAKELVEFLKYDSILGKSVTDKFAIVNDKKEGIHIVYQGKSKINIKIINSTELNKSFVKKLKIDIIVDFSNKSNIEIFKLNKLGSKTVIINDSNFSLFKNKENLINCYGLSNEKIDISKNSLITIPRIETTIINLINKNLDLKIEHIDFQVIKGPKEGMKIVDSMVDLKKIPFELSRSVINNIIPSSESKIIVEESEFLLENKKSVSISGNVSFVPVTTGSLINLTFYCKKSNTLTEFTKLIKENINNLVGYTEDRIVAQDIVSTNFYGVVDKNLIKCINKKTYSICKVGIWFDCETSFVISAFKTIQYIVGTSGFNKKKWSN